MRWLAVLAVVIPLAAVAAGAVALSGSKAQLEESPTALARISLPLGGGQIEQVVVSRALDNRGVPVSISDGVITPTTLIPAGERLDVDAVVKRPGWISWLTGSTERLHLSLRAPVAAVAGRFLTRRQGQPLRIVFKTPVRVFETGSNARTLHRSVLGTPQTEMSVAESAVAGTIIAAGAPRTWEKPRATFISWFPPGSHASAVAAPAPGTPITPHTPITLTFSKPISQALGSTLPPVSPTTNGSWHRINSHTIKFIPTGYGYGLGANVVVSLPAAINLVSGVEVASDPQGRWSVPDGSTLRLQQLLAGLGYLPVTFTATGAPVANTMTAQENAAVAPPQGTFSWRYANTPADLESEWAPGSYGELTKGAVMAFENDHGLTPDGVAGQEVWKTLIAATLANQVSTFGYTYVNVSEESVPESIDVWHNGSTVVSGPVNTGVAAAPTAQGVFAVFEHLTVTTMTGTNPDGSHYSDPGIPWVSYFNGGDALHGFIRASYGFPQSDGCVEMPFAQAHAVFPYTPIGTIVNVH